MIRIALELVGALAFIAAALLVNLVIGLIVVGIVCWVAAAFADWEHTDGDTGQHAGNDDGAELPEG